MRCLIDHCYCTAGESGIVIRDFEKGIITDGGKSSMFGILVYVARGMIPETNHMADYGITIQDLIHASMCEAANEDPKYIVEGVFGSTWMPVHMSEARLKIEFPGLSAGVFRHIIRCTKFGVQDMATLFKKNDREPRIITVRELAKCRTLRDVKSARIRLEWRLSDLAESYALPSNAARFKACMKQAIAISAHTGRTMKSPKYAFNGAEPYPWALTASYSQDSRPECLFEKL